MAIISRGPSTKPCGVALNQSLFPLLTGGGQALGPCRTAPPRNKTQRGDNNCTLLSSTIELWFLENTFTATHRMPDDKLKNTEEYIGIVGKCVA
jgi:hypothetical protein